MADEGRPDCTEQQHCAKMTPQERTRRCACRAVTEPRKPWTLTELDRTWLRSLRIAGDA